MTDGGFARVDDRQQPIGQLRVGAVGQLRPLARRALLEVVELGLHSLKGFEVLVALGGQVGTPDRAVDERLLVVGAGSRITRGVALGEGFLLEYLVVGELGITV